MNIDCPDIARREPRFTVRMPVTVSGMGKDGHYFTRSAETLNGSTEGMGILLDLRLYPSTSLVISIRRQQQVLRIQSEVRHVTPFDNRRNLVGVRFQEMVFI
jgi:hypothetical protein